MGGMVYALVSKVMEHRGTTPVNMVTTDEWPTNIWADADYCGDKGNDHYLNGHQTTLKEGGGCGDSCCVICHYQVQVQEEEEGAQCMEENPNGCPDWKCPVCYTSEVFSLHPHPTLESFSHIFGEVNHHALPMGTEAAVTFVGAESTVEEEGGPPAPFTGEWMEKVLSTHSHAWATWKAGSCEVFPKVAVDAERLAGVIGSGLKAMLEKGFMDALLARLLSTYCLQVIKQMGSGSVAKYNESVFPYIGNPNITYPHPLGHLGWTLPFTTSTLDLSALDGIEGMEGAQMYNELKGTLIDMGYMEE
jgi:hypothetical protein